MRPSSATQALTLFSSLPKTLIFNAEPQPSALQLSRPKRWKLIVTMRDRSNNPRPLQKGRHLSIEAIQTVQALKRAKKNQNFLEQAFDYKFRRLLKLDMMAVLRDLLRQNECFLALKVFEDIRKEHWYRPQVSLYADMIKVMASNELFEQVELLCLCLKKETNLQPELEAFNALLTTLISFNIPKLAMECYYLMKEVGCEPDRSSFRILINGLESMGETGFSGILRQDAQQYYGESLEFLEENEEMAVK
ncbi:pentatricopeptide repeat-containing protein [Prunus yedoensis var. nudiflora]|uniref:Pentatricopeptide repeat-containing protein n=1 Tax=Prunus yedoensis var. nudiflora TaxID=2094558 RepID=A0A314ZNH3_PRUYE|nr:pentatricopeptide repeat-containing protein [Prunus yedoensis var. nudiflora]